jgi:hypothetical protein
MIGACDVMSRKESECYLLVLNSVIYTAVDMPEPRNVHDVCVLVCEFVYVCSKVLGPCIPRTSLLMSFLAFRRSHFASCCKDSR